MARPRIWEDAQLHIGFVVNKCPRVAPASLIVASRAAYANNQHRLDELAADLDQTPFARAMRMSKGWVPGLGLAVLHGCMPTGTVSILDTHGVSWTRIWW